MPPKTRKKTIDATTTEIEPEKPPEPAGSEAELERLLKKPFDAKSIIDGEDMLYKNQAGEPTKLNIKFVKMLASTGDGVIITDAEALIFMRVCKQYNLDPFLRQIYLIKYDGSKPASNVIATQTYLQKADGYESYKGYEGGWIITADKAGEQILAEECKGVPAGTAIIGAWCRVIRDGRRQPPYEALISEYQKKNRKGEVMATWKTMPQTMIAKCARGGAHRMAFPNLIGPGLVTEDEVGGFQHTMPEIKTADTARVEERSKRTGDIDKDVRVIGDELPPLYAKFKTLADLPDNIEDDKAEWLFNQFASFLCGEKPNEYEITENEYEYEGNTDINYGAWSLEKIDQLLAYMEEHKKLPQEILDLIPKAEAESINETAGELFDAEAPTENIPK